MTIGIFTCFRKIYEDNMKFGTYLILRGGLYSGELIFGGLIFGILRYSHKSYTHNKYLRSFMERVPVERRRASNSTHDQ